MKLLTEVFDTVNIIEESTEGSPKKMFIEGIFMQADVKNKNGRVYPKSIMESELNRYNTEFVNQNRAVGELGHGSSPSINLDRISHKISTLGMNGSNVLGKAQLLDTPCGRIAQELVKAGVQLGVSSKAMGTTNSKGIVNTDFRIIGVDIVADPSAPQAMVNAIHESKEWIFENGIWTEKQLDESKHFLENKGSISASDAELHVYNYLFNLLK